jgi:hypothetical protein
MWRVRGELVVLVSHQLGRFVGSATASSGWMTARFATAHVRSRFAYESSMSFGDRSSGMAQIQRQGSVHRLGDCRYGRRTTACSFYSRARHHKFRRRAAQPVVNGEHGVALFNSERQLIWARAAEPDSRTWRPCFLAHVPIAPTASGAYQWQASLWDNGEMLDRWDGVPDMNIATKSAQHYMDEWNGILNLPSDFSMENKRKSDRIPANHI